MDFLKKSLLNLSQYFFYVLDFGHEACGILALQPGMEPAPPALEDELLTSGPPGKSLWFSYRKSDRRDGNPRSKVNLPPQVLPTPCPGAGIYSHLM